MTRASAAQFLRRHPVICLLLLTPGIPEYLSGSSPMNAIVLNPPMFVVQLAADLGLYGPGVLLVREAMIRWSKGWGSVLLLGAAYGILEEGIALSTLFDPSATQVGELGVYGHWAGVNWVWLAGILPVHMIYSISVPIMLLGIALPETKGVRFLDGRKLPAAFVILGVDVTVLSVFILFGAKFWMGAPVFVGSWTAIGLLVVAARRIRADAIMAKSEKPKAGPRRLAVLGVAFYPSILLSEFVIKAMGIPALVDFFIVIGVQDLFLVYLLRVVGSGDNERNLVAFALGLVIPIATFGTIAGASLPVVLVADFALVAFFHKLLRLTSSRQLFESGARPSKDRNQVG